MAAVLFVSLLVCEFRPDRTFAQGQESGLGISSQLSSIERRSAAGVGDWVAHEWHIPGQRALQNIPKSRIFKNTG